MIYKTRLIPVCIFILMGSVMLYPRNWREGFLWETEQDTSHHYMEFIKLYETTIDWTSGKIRSEISIPIMEEDANIGRQITAYSADIRHQLRQNLIKALGSLRISEIFLLRDYYSLKSDLRYEIIANVDKAFYYPPIKKFDRYYGAIELDIFGDSGLANIFYRNIDRRPLQKYVDEARQNMEYFDGLVIDTTLFRNFNPSIELRIYDQDGVLLFGPETMERDALFKNGVCKYTTSLYYALNSPRSGKRIFYLMPYDVTGKMFTDIVIHNSDAERIFSNPRTVAFLNQGNVIVVKPQRE
jgi:hypothetical protein